MQNSRPSFRIAQELGAKRTGNAGKFFMVGHHPHPMRKSVLTQYYQANHEVLVEQTSYRFRSIKQFTPASLANHLEINRHGAKIKRPASEAYIRPRREFMTKRAMKKVRDGSANYGCIQNLDVFPPETLTEFRKILGEKFKGFLPAAITFSD